MINLTKYFAEIKDDLGITSIDTFSQGVESWSEFVAMKDSDGDLINIFGYMECAEIENHEQVTLLLNPSPWISGEYVVSFQETSLGAGESLRIYFIELSTGGYLLVGMRVLNGIFTDSYGWYAPAIESMRKDTREEMRDYLEFD